jgi:threonine synthase
MDTHTAVAYVVNKKYKEETGDISAAVIASTASPFKFPKSINEALHFADSDASEFEMVQQLSEKMNLRIPKGIQGLDKKEIRHKTTCGKDEMRDVIRKFLSIK